MKRKRTSTIQRNENIWGYAFIVLPFIGLILFTLLPLIISIYSSFTAWPLGQSLFDAKFIGWDNYKEVLNSDMFWKSLGNTFYYMIGIPIGLVISLTLAMMMNRGTRYENTFRVIYYIPVITSTVAISFVFRQLFSSDSGIVNNILSNFGIEDTPFWLSDPRYTKWVIIIMTVWKGIGNSIIMYIAGMQGIDAGLYEAATIDGANSWKRFRYITIPLLRPVTFYLIVTSVIGGTQMYTEPRLVYTANGPANSTFTTVIHLYDYTFVHSRAGYGSAVAVILAIIVFILTAMMLYSNRRSRK